MHIVHVNLAKGFRGGERQTTLLIRNLAAQQPANQTLVCRADSPMRQLLRDVAGLKFVDAAKQWQGHHQVGSADIVHAHEAKAVHWAWLHYVRYRTPYLLTRRVANPLKQKWLNHQTYGHAAAIVALSQAIKFELMRLCPEEKIAVIPSVYASLDTGAESVEWPFEMKDTFIVGHIGALFDAQKGQMDLVRAAEIVAINHSDVHFVFLGSGDDEASLKAASAHLNNVHWLGFKNNVGDYLAAMNMFAFPSRMEGLGSTLLDVAAYGIPIVATRVGGIPDIVVDGETGLLVESGQPQQLAAAIVRLYQDERLRQHLSANATAALSRFAPEKMAADYWVLYCDITEKTKTQQK